MLVKYNLYYIFTKNIIFLIVDNDIFYVQFYRLKQNNTHYFKNDKFFLKSVTL